MRLTLRTLLAYLDDVLEPAQAREIGQKIAESPVATSLAQRIREVMRRRRLSAEDLDATGLDPNLVADYIDGSLSPAEVTDVEKVCLESDAHLAEVAACHQILTIVLGEPVEINSGTRERMYGLADDGTVTKLAVPASSNGSPAAVAVEPEEKVSFPAHLRPAPLWKRALPVIVPVILIGLWVGLIAIDDTFSFLNPFANPKAGKAPQEIVVAKTDNGSAPVKTARHLSDEEEPAISNGSAKPESVKPDVPIDRNPPPDLPEVAANATAEGGNSIALTAPKPEDIEIVAETNVTTPPAPAELAAVPVGRYASSDGVLLQYLPPRNGWFVVPYDSQLLANNRLIVPEPFSAEIKLDGSAPAVRLVGGAVAVVLSESDVAPSGIRLSQGRVLLDAGTPQPAPFAIQAGTRSWRIEFLNPATRVGIEMHPLRVIGFEAPLPENHYYLALTVVRGSVRVGDDRGNSLMVDAGVSVLLHDDSGAIIARAGEKPALPAPDTAAVPRASPALPGWMEPEKQVMLPLLQRYYEEFQKEFDPSLSAAENMIPLVIQHNLQLGVYAVKCLALIEHVDALVKTLALAEHKEMREAAAHGLRIWLPRHPEEWESFRKRDTLQFPENSVGALEHLLWGFPPEKAYDPNVSRQLIDWMDDRSIAIRELAFGEVTRLTGDLEFGYNPGYSESIRRRALDRWENHLKKDGALLGPSEQPK